MLEGKLNKRNLSRTLVGASLVALLELSSCKTVTINGAEVRCIEPYSSYPIGHPCYETPSRSSGTSSSSSHEKDYSGKDGHDHDKSSKGGHYEGCKK